ncbi:acyl-CoA desaturase [Hahella sp. NBU794]|uniref:acyl-CoA desaturase n=1 Tax=Hahella sp. NBU794 TaxID=3422590 RepID=UPI003D6F906F
MQTNHGVPRIQETANCCPYTGEVVWAPLKSFWYLGHLLIAIIGGYLTFSLDALLVFVVFTAATLCLGHSLGMHRRLIHGSYECPKWMEYFFVHLGVLVGMAGPLGMVYQHDLRDWAQRKAKCHSYLRHGTGFLTDGWRQLNCDLRLERPPEFSPESAIKDDPVYRFTERTWMWQQLPWALLLYWLGDISWVIWGISVRVAVSVTGHWLIGYFAHNSGERDWHVNGAAVQGHNVRFAGLLTMGESWHNNHHAFPGSAMLGIYKGQSDPGWWVLNRLMNVGLVWNVRLPEHLPVRPELSALTPARADSEAMKEPSTCPLLGCMAKP